MAIVNIGILAHVDAGKTTLTERILYETGVIRDIGSVDKGTTQTDTLDLERARGITIKSAVVSFNLGDLKVNLVDTPGHPDFIAEVERSLSVLDGVVLVISAVEGVQSQTRRLARAIRATDLPMLIFVNKIDRVGARCAALLDDIERKLSMRIVSMTDPDNHGDRAASIQSVQWWDRAWRERVIDLLDDGNEAVIAEFDRTGGRIGDAFLAAEIKSQVANGKIAPVYFGSAITGVGVPEMLTGVREWLPEATHWADQPLTGTVFKIARVRSGEKVVFARIESGGLRVRDQVRLHRHTRLEEPAAIEERVTAIDHFAAGTTVTVAEALAGEIVRLHGLRGAQIGDRLGEMGCLDHLATAPFPPPALESAVHPIKPDEIIRLRFALEQLAEQDPLISLRQRNDAGELSVRLYGEVQKEVILDTLANEYGVEAWFGPSQTICIERVIGAGEHIENIGGNGNPFPATVGLRVEPGPQGSGIRYVRELGALPLAFYRALEETVYESLSQGLWGWEVTDCLVTLTQRGMTPATVAGDYRLLTPLVLMQALTSAGTTVCEPIDDLDLEIPEDAFGPVCGALLNAGAAIGDTVPNGFSLQISCQIPAANLRMIEQQLPGLTGGEGSWETRFAGHRPVPADHPIRERVGPNPLNRARYLAEIARS
jgi:ribosomal protection tetracycline resistance protein